MKIYHNGKHYDATLVKSALDFLMNAGLITKEEISKLVSQEQKQEQQTEEEKATAKEK